MHRRLFIVALVTLVLAAPAEARRKKNTATTAPGTYEKWGPEIDEIEIVKTFDLGKYKNIVVVPFETSDVELPKQDDNTYEPVQKVLAATADPFVEGFGKEFPATISVAEKPGKASDTLIIRGKIVTMDPGSKAKRYFAGFGAGAARTKLIGEIADARSGAVLVRFTQERRSGVGMMGGDYVSLMNRNLRAIGEDAANILKAFQGEN
jgi:hypothetical protein